MGLGNVRLATSVFTHRFDSTSPIDLITDRRTGHNVGNQGSTALQGLLCTLRWERAETGVRGKYPVSYHHTCVPLEIQYSRAQLNWL